MNPIKHQFKTLLFIVTVVALPGMTPAQTLTAVPQVDYNVEELTYPPLPDFKVPEPRLVTLDNGLQIFLLEDHELPEISISARIGTGSLWEPANMIGLAALTGTVMRSGGTTTLSPDEVDQALANVGATVETGIGESSGFAYMNTLSEHINTVLPIFADVLMHPAFAEKKVNLAKTRSKSAISRRNDNPRGVAMREFSQLLYGVDSPYARVPQYYTISRIERQDVVDFYNQYFVPNNIMLAVWGDFDSDRMLERLRDAFGGWEANPGFTHPAPPPITGTPDPGVYFVPMDDVTQSIVLMGHLGEITRDHPDYFPVIVMNQVLSGGFAGRLFRNVRSDQGLAYAVYGVYSAGYEHKGTFLAGVGTRTATTVEAARAVLEQIRSMREQAPTAEELRIAKGSFLNAFVFNFDTRREILGRLMTYAYYGYPRDFLNQIRQGVQEVTSEGVLRVANQYLHPDQLEVLVVSSEKVAGQLEKLAGEGKVHEIDIRIPTVAPSERAAPAGKAEQAAGAALLGKVRGALGGAAFDSITSLRMSSSATVQSPTGEQKIESQAAIKLPDSFNLQTTLPNGMRVTMISNGEDIMLKLGGQTRPVPPQMQAKTMGRLWHDLAYLMVRADAVSAAASEEVTTDGKMLKALIITPPGEVSPFTLLIDPKTLRPVRMRYQAMTPMGPAWTEDVLSDYRTIDGISVPFRVERFRGGKSIAVSTGAAFEVNPELDPAMFKIE